MDDIKKSWEENTVLTLEDLKRDPRKWSVIVDCVSWRRSVWDFIHTIKSLMYVDETDVDWAELYKEVENDIKIDK